MTVHAIPDDFQGKRSPLWDPEVLSCSCHSVPGVGSEIFGVGLGLKEVGKSGGWHDDAESRDTQSGGHSSRTASALHPDLALPQTRTVRP